MFRIYCLFKLIKLIFYIQQNNSKKSGLSHSFKKTYLYALIKRNSLDQMRMILNL